MSESKRPINIANTRTWGLLLALCVAFTTQSFSQSTSILVDDIQIIGNHKTKNFIILRELEFALGDTIFMDELASIIKTSEENLFRTKLFFEVGVNWTTEKLPEGEKNIFVVQVREAWYIYPVPILEFADRNFNVWWNEMNASLNRINLGLRLDHLNLSGRNDRFNIKGQVGYEQKWELKYFLPNINKNKTWGMKSNVLFAQRKEIGYRAEDNILLFARADRNVYQRFRATQSFIYRPRFQQNHEIKLEYYQNWIDSSFVNQYNERFFRGGRNGLKWFVLEYAWRHDNTNHFNYPTAGWTAEGIIRKEGLGLFDQVNLWNISLAGAQYFTLDAQERWSIGMAAKARLLFTPDNPGYYHNTALGYGSDQLRGYEFYVIDGQHYGYAKTNVNYRLWSVNRNFGKWMFIPQFRGFSMDLFLSASLDVGYVTSDYFNETNAYNNRMLMGGGPGIHVLLYHYFLFRLEYSYNAASENGVFLHFKALF